MTDCLRLQLVHELWEKLKEVEGEAKAKSTQVAIERQELTKAKQQLQRKPPSQTAVCLPFL